MQTNNANYYLTIASVKVYTIDYVMDKYWPNLYPKNISSLWEQTIVILYGNNDKKYIWGIMLDEDTTATTWNIAPGNFVGYVKVLFNDKIIKIPYYNG